MSVWIEGRICKGCQLCVHNCPKKTLGISEHRNAKGSEIVEQVYPQNCIKCGRCMDICPDLAIWVSKKEL